MASPGPRLALDRLAGASSNLAAAAGGTSVDELRWRRGLLVRAQARAWGVEKGGGGPGEVGAATSTRNRRTMLWLRWIFVAAATAPCCRRSWLKEENSEGEGENAEEGSDSGIRFNSSRRVHARGEWGHDLSKMDTWRQTSVLVGHVQVLQVVQKHLKNQLKPSFSRLTIS